MKESLSKRVRRLVRKAREGWNGLSPRERTWVAGAAAVDLSLKAAAWHFLYHSPAQRIRGPKWVWVPVTTFINTFGSLAFFAFGLKRK